MKRNKKLTVVALSVMLVMALATTVISFTLANLNDKRSNDTTDQAITLQATAAGLTNIDYIIKASAEEGAEPYKIVEIGSVAKSSSDFGSFATDGRFKDYVIDGNRTIEDLMADGMIEYKYYYSGAVTGDNEEALAYIASADFVYVSAEQPYSISAGNDLGEDLYNLLHVTAVGDYKPFIIDKPESAGTSTPIVGENGAKLVFNTMIENYFIKMGYNYKAYYWNDTSMTGADDVAKATKFYQAAIGSGSNYVGVNGRNRQTKWTNIKLTADAADQFKMADVLVISSGGTALSSGTMFNKLTAGKSAAVTTVFEVGADSATTELVLGANQAVYGIDGSPLHSYGYNARYAIEPDYIRATELTLAQLETEEYASHDFTQYDMVIFEDDCDSKEISDALYKKLVGVMYANVQIVYNYSLGGASSGNGGSGGGATVDETSNFYELYLMVATESGLARYQNIMLTEKSEMDIIMSSNSASTCKVIADLINNSSFRGIGGPGSTSTTFTVLEIQPCYPIDLDIAQANGQYYTIPSDVINGKTKEQLGIQVDESGNTIVTDETPEYYEWELSEAKVADALNMDVKQVKVVHMSSEEFATSKDAVLGNYDMVYIGGNRSALKPIENWAALKGLHNDYTFAQAKNIEKLPIYTMYTHTGDMLKNVLSVEEGPIDRGTPISAAPGKTPGETFVTLNGNDITYNGLVELQKFVDAGMPVIISDDVANAYIPFIKEARENNKSPYLQNSIDPESNVCKFLDYCVEKKSVTWGFDQLNTEYIDNDGGRLGDTLTGTVEVFKDTSKTAFYDAYFKNNKRPKLAVTSMPAVYNVYDPSTKTKSLTLNFKFEVTGSSGDYTVNLYADYDKNSIFIQDEIIATSNNVTSISANLANIEKYGATHSGPVYWKLEVVDNASKATVSTAKLAYIQPLEDTRKQIRVLQILPDESIGQAYGANSWTSLIFCTQCQRSIEILDRNPVYSGDLSIANLYDGKLGEEALDANGCCNGIYSGKHEHTFGVVRYDSATTVDDWYYNYADDVSDMFDISIDVMDSREFERTSAQVLTDLDEFLAINYAGADITALDADQVKSLKAALTERANVAKAEYDAYVTLDAVLENNFDGRLFENLSDSEIAALKADLTSEDEALALAELELKSFILSIKDSTGSTEANQAFNNIYESGLYGDYIFLIESNNNIAAHWHYAEYKALYETYARAMDKRIELKEAYDRLNRVAHYDNWLLGCYESVIIGPSESFSGDDIKTEPALNVLSGYVNGGGHTLMFHDTLTKYSDAGAYNLTLALIDSYGMDKNHAELDTDILGTGATITETVETIKSNNDKYNTSITVTEAGQQYGTTYNNLQLSCWYEYINISFKLGDQNSGKVDGYGEKNLSAGDNVKFNFTVTDNANNAYTGTINVTIDGVVYTVSVNNGVGSVDVPNYNSNVVTTTYDADDVWNLPYKLKEGYSDEKYILPNISYRDTDDLGRYFAWQSDMDTVFDKMDAAGHKYYSPLYAYTDSIKLGHNDNEPYSPYKYATVDWHACTQNGYQALVASLGSNKASQTNKGIMTMFPFNLSDELNIAPTHAQAYAIDLDNEKLSVWYTIGGGSNNKDASEMQAATPHDGMDNYFIYTVGNLNYCGAGHTKVTGQNKDNNDERMLYINIICNSVTNVATTEINAYDHSSTADKKTNNVVKKQGNEYIYKLDEDDYYPEFSFMFELGNGQTLSSVNVYYDIDGSITYTPNKDKYIKQYTSSQVSNGKLVYVPVSATDEDELKSLYLDPTYLTNGKYVYIVIEVVTDKGTYYKRIKVEYKDKLYNLT